jgi:hypothetical protein
MSWFEKLLSAVLMGPLAKWGILSHSQFAPVNGGSGKLIDNITPE